MSDYQKIITIFNTDNQIECLNNLSILLRETLRDTNVSYFEFDEIEGVLTEKSTGHQVQLSVKSNPISYSFITMKTYFINKLTAHPEFPAAIVPAVQREGQCFLIPLKSLGVLAFFSIVDDLSCKENEHFIQDISDVFQCALQLRLKQSQLEAREKQMTHHLLDLQERDSHRLMVAHIDRQWVDVSASSKSFKRDVLYYAQTKRVLTIIGEYGIGRHFLATQIQYLRNTYGYQKNSINLSKITDIIQLKSIFGYRHKKTGYLNFQYGNTLVLKNLDSLSPVLFNQLYEILSNDEHIARQNVKIITTSQRRIYHQNYSSEAVAFFAQEKLHLSNRLLKASNVLPFAMCFIADYCQKNLKTINGISTDAIETLTTTTTLTPKILKAFIIRLCDALPDGGKIEQSHVSNHLKGALYTVLPDTLTSRVALYEKNIILKALALND